MNYLEMMHDFWKRLWVPFVKMGCLLFGEGWIFLLPYVVLYTVAVQRNWETVSLYRGFVTLHVFMVPLAVSYVLRRVIQAARGEVLFWILLLAVLWIPGAYLEFPADPWAHVSRIFLWGNAKHILDHPIFYKFSYFMTWSYLAKLTPINHRLGLDLWSAMVQWLLLYQFYCLFRAVGLQKALSYLLVVGVLAFFGTNLFSFRYYALSSTPFAYIAYLRFLILLIEGRYGVAFVLKLFAVTLLVWTNHRQEFLLAGVSAVALLIWYLVRRWQSFGSCTRLAILAILFALAAIGLVVGLHPQQVFERLDGRLLAGLAGTRAVRWDEFGHALSRFGTFRLWDIRAQHFETLAIPGIIGAVSAILLWRKYTALSLLAICPIVLFSFPPFVLLLSCITPHGNTYRILYAFPTAVCAILGVYELAHWSLRHQRPALWCTWGVVLAILFLLPVQSPWRNRMPFQLYFVPADRSLTMLDPLAQWFSENRSRFPFSCLITDDVTDFVLAAHLGSSPRWGRLERLSPVNLIQTPEQLQRVIADYRPCAILSVKESVPRLTSPSWVADSSGHWQGGLADVREASAGLPSRIHRLTAMGWKDVAVPGPYRLVQMGPSR